MTASFDLTTQPWIPCERMDGTRVELSTHDALVEAHALRGITDGSPLVVAALHRHLLAVLHRVVDGPRGFEAWAEVVKRGVFPPERVADYLAGVRERMDLFHPTHPFAQVRGLVEVFPDHQDPIDQLGFERARWGGGRELFQHRPDDHRAVMGPAEAARTLLAHHAFATGGLVKKPGEPTSATAAPLVPDALRDADEQSPLLRPGRRGADPRKRRRRSRVGARTAAEAPAPIEGAATGASWLARPPHLGEPPPRARARGRRGRPVRPRGRAGAGRWFAP